MFESSCSVFFTLGPLASGSEPLASGLANPTSCANRLGVCLELLLWSVHLSLPVQAFLKTALVLVCASALLLLRDFLLLVVWRGLFSGRSGTRVVYWGLCALRSCPLGLTTFTDRVRLR